MMMRKIPIFFAALLVSFGLAVAGWAQMTTLQSGSSPKTAPYTGLCDIVAPQAFWGLRACGSATADGTHKAVNLIRASDSHTCDLLLTTSGGLGDTTSCSTGGDNGQSASTFCNATACSVVKAYDQSGNGLDLVNLSGSSLPIFTFNVLNGKPAIDYTSDNTMFLRSTSFSASYAQPWAQSLVFNITSHTSFQSIFTDNNGAAGEGIVTRNVANTAIVRTSSQFDSVAANDGQFHALNWRANGASGAYSIDGTSATATADLGTDAWQGPATGWPGTSVAMVPVYILEGAFYSSNVSDANLAAIGNNQKTYWGPF